MKTPEFTQVQPVNHHLWQAGRGANLELCLYAHSGWDGGGALRYRHITNLGRILLLTALASTSKCPIFGLMPKILIQLKLGKRFPYALCGCSF